METSVYKIRGDRTGSAAKGIQKTKIIMCKNKRRGATERRKQEREEDGCRTDS